MKIATNTVLQICGLGNSWKVASLSDPKHRVQARSVQLFIEGDPTEGYHLVISPEGCFTADTWHQSIEEAKATASEAFGVDLNDWN